MKQAENSANGRGSFGGNRAVIQGPGAGKFLTGEPSVLIANGEYSHLPMIGGATRQDGSFVVSGW